LLVIDADDQHDIGADTTESYSGVVIRDGGELQMQAGGGIGLTVSDGSDGSDVPGDITGDGQVDIADATRLGQAWDTTEGESDYDPAADLNDDSTINIFDATILGRNWQTNKQDTE